MKRVLFILFVLLVVFAFASCKQDVEEGTKTPTEPEYVEPIEEPGVLFVRPAEGASFSQSGKFQFNLNVQYEAGVSITLYAKFSSDIYSVAVRQGEGDNTKFKVNGNDDQQLKNLEKEDGWYLVYIPAESVTPTEGADKELGIEGTPVDSWIGLGITAYTNATERTNCFVALKGLKFGDDYFDITEWDEDSCAKPYYTSPSALDVYLTMPAE